MRIGVIIHGLTFFKALGGIVEEALADPDIVPTIFYFTGHYGKPYDKADPAHFPRQFKRVRCVGVPDYSLLPNLLRAHKIDWLVGIELALKIPNILKIAAMGIKTCSVCNFTDGLWSIRSDIKKLKRLNLICYQAPYTYNLHNKILGEKDRKNCCVCGVPMTDAIKHIKNYNIRKRYGIPQKYLLLMIPNLKSVGEHRIAFGSVDNSVNTFRAIYKAAKARGLSVIGKSRKKQVYPPAIDKYFDKVIYDELYYPSTAFLLMSKAVNTVIFNSLSVFEVASVDKFAINISTNMNVVRCSGTPGFNGFFYGVASPFIAEGVNKTLKIKDVDKIGDYIGRKCDFEKLDAFKKKYIMNNNNSKNILRKMKK